MGSRFDCAISLGPACRTGYQIRRVFGRGRVLPSVFDRQTTPVATIAHAFENDFCGMFERAEFTEKGTITHKRLGFANMHGFGDNRDAHYGAMLREHKTLVSTTQRALRSRRKILFVIETDDEAAVRKISDMICLRRDGAPFSIAAVWEANNPSATWKGNNRSWDDALEPYRVRRTVECSLIEWSRRARKHILGKYRS